MSDLPKGWIYTTLENLVSYKKGKKPKHLITKNEKGYVPYIDIKAFEKNNIQQYADMESSKIATDEDVLVVWDGARCGLVGKSINGAIGSTIMCLTPHVIKNDFIVYFLKTKYDSINSANKGTGIPHVKPEIFWNIEVPLPPLNEQKRIVEKLDKLLAKVETAKERLDKIPSILKKYRQSVLHAAVTGELTKEWREENNLNKQKSIELLNEIFAELKKHYPQKKFRKINLENNFAPSRWTNSYMDNLFEVQTGATPLRKNLVYWENGNIPWIKSGEVNNSDIKKSSEFITELAIEETNVKLFPKETILVAMYGEGKTRGQVGILKLEATTNQACAALVNPNLNAITRKFVYLYCLSQYEDIRRKSSGGNQPNLNLSKIKDWIISIPSLEEQKEIVSRVEKLLSTADEIEARYKKAKEYVDKLSQSILAKAFRGELVPQDPNDEPAEKLLERIKAEKEKEEKKKKRPIKRHK